MVKSRLSGQKGKQVAIFIVILTGERIANSLCALMTVHSPGITHQDYDNN